VTRRRCRPRRPARAPRRFRKAGRETGFPSSGATGVTSLRASAIPTTGRGFCATVCASGFQLFRSVQPGSLVNGPLRFLFGQSPASPLIGWRRREVRPRVRLRERVSGKIGDYLSTPFPIVPGNIH
jgi:hypothetical protein